MHQPYPAILITVVGRRTCIHFSWRFQSLKKFRVGINNVGFFLTWMTYHVYLTLGSRSFMVTFRHTVWKLNQKITVKDCICVQENRDCTCKWQEYNIVLTGDIQLCYTKRATKKYPAFRFAYILVMFSLALVCILRRVFEQSVNSRAVTMLRYTRCNIVILMAATVWLMLSFSSYIACGFDSYTVLFKFPQRNVSGDTLKVWYTNQIRTRYRKWSHAVAAIKITMLHPVYLNMIRFAQLCTDAGGNNFQHLLWWYIISTFGYCINFCIYAMLRSRATFSWSTPYNMIK